MADEKIIYYLMIFLIASNYRKSDKEKIIKLIV